jgi:hypothetical protein
MRALFFLIIKSVLSIDSYFDPKYVSQIKSSEINFYIERPDYQTIVIIYDLLNYKSIFLGESLLPLLPRLNHLIKIFAISCENDPKFCTVDMKENLPAVQSFIPRGISPLTGSPLISEKIFTEDFHPFHLNKFITENVPYLGDFVGKDYIEEFLSLPMRKVFIFLRDEEIDNDLKALSSKFRGRLEFGVVFINQTEILDKFQVYRFPSILVVENEKNTWFEGVFIFEDLVKFLSPFAAAEKQKLRPRRFLNEFFDPDQLAFLPEFPVIPVSSVNFSEVVGKNEEFSVIHVHKDRPSPIWEEVLKEYKGVVKFYDLRSEDSSLIDLGNQKLPFIKLLPSKKTRGMILTSENLQDLEKELSLALKSEVSVLHDSSITSFINTLDTQSKVGFFLVSQNKVPIQIKALGKVPIFQHFIKIGFTNLSKDQVLKKFDIDRYPSFFAFVKKKSGLRILEFQGKLNDFPSLYYFVEKIALEKLLVPLNQTFHQLDDLEDLDPVKEIKTFSALSKSCLTSSHLCFLFPETFSVTFKQSRKIAKSPDDLKMIENVKMVQAVIAKRNFYAKVFSFNQTCHEEFFQSLGIENEKPVVIALDSERKKLAFFDAKENLFNIGDFVFKVLKRDVNFNHFNTSTLVFEDKSCSRIERQEL